MNQTRSNLHRYAMLFGTYMGVFWILKFILLPLGSFAPFSQNMFFILTLLVPFMGYFYTRLYRNEACEGSISFAHAWLFTTFMYMFASLLTTVGHYVYFEFFDQGEILNHLITSLDQAAAQQPPEAKVYAEMWKEAIQLIFTQPPIHITVNSLSSNVIGGSILAVPTALFAMRKGKGTQE